MRENRRRRGRREIKERGGQNKGEQKDRKKGEERGRGRGTNEKGGAIGPGKRGVVVRWESHLQRGLSSVLTCTGVGRGEGGCCCRCWAAAPRGRPHHHG